MFDLLFLSFLTDWSFIACNYIIFHSIYSVLVFYKSARSRAKYKWG